MIVQPLSNRRKRSTNAPKILDRVGIQIHGENTGTTDGGAFVPEWIQQDGIMLRFRASHVGGGQNVDARRFVILYHVSDSTYEVLYDDDDDDENRGKVFLKRYCNTSCLKQWDKPNPFDFDIGQCVNVVGHVFSILDMCPFTKMYLESQGRTISDACLGTREENDKVKQTPSCKPHERLTSYLSHGECVGTQILKSHPQEWNGVILRFWAVDVYTKREYLIKYHVEDCSIELFEFLDTCLTKTQKILSRTNFIDPVGSLMKSTEAAASIIAGAFQPHEFLMGKQVKICGRHMVIHKADNHSRAWMATNIANINTTNLEEIPLPSSMAENNRMKQGTKSKQADLDSEEVLSLAPSGLESMQFLATLSPYPKTSEKNQDTFNQERKFIIQVYCSDFSICIKEMNVQTPGSFGSKFLERQRVYKDLAKKRGTLQPFEFYIGSEVEIYGRRFEILDADKVTLEYIADHPEYFTRADGTGILCEVRSVLQKTYAESSNMLNILQKNLPHVSKAAIISACMILGQASGIKMKK